ncbi:ankyrin repeat-containing domain protein [Gamsiella multidivaricata]|uniref:ankyrin repeat-containing domain protein n=1 Tax=Gamsiella multidivaricata TaxID=101098 RepID=UPI002220FD03|nr:ankyrin repeat-containing domain protein [Gamsiella multidivaricata]KAI7827588.1 ankyrin repeat-containing domain protein [Gamsiella multidivaricata]
MTAEQLTSQLSSLSVQDSEHLEELIECARYGELEEIQAVVESSGPEKAKVLLSHQGEYGKTPLHMAAANGHIAVIEEHRKQDTRGSEAEYETFDLAKRVSDNVVEYLISIISPEAINIQNEQGNTALHWAATNGHAKVVETLITKGKANYKLKNAAGHTAMLEAEIHEREQVVAWMLINTEPEEELKEGNDNNDEDSDEDEDEDSDEEEEETKDDKAAQGSSSTPKA